MGRYNRSNFLKGVSVNGILEKDLLSSTFNDYNFKRPMQNYRLQYEDYIRPDLISIKAYGTQDYWWIILKCNPELEDIWNDYVVDGSMISVSASLLDSSITNDYMVLVNENEYLYPNSYRPGQIINIPNILDVQDFYTYTKNTLI